MPNSNLHDVLNTEFNKLTLTIREMRGEMQSLIEAVEQSRVFHFQTVYFRTMYLYQKCKVSSELFYGVPFKVLQKMYTKEFNSDVIDDIFKETHKQQTFEHYLKNKSNVIILKQKQEETLSMWLLIYEEEESFESSMEQVNKLNFQYNELQIPNEYFFPINEKLFYSFY
jgi:hypothetical protein